MQYFLHFIICTFLQGEAIAFVLGGSKKMLRAKNLRSLINHQVQKAGSDTAKV